MMGMDTKQSTIVAFIDFDCCYYNVVRRMYGIHPWTVITNRFNNIISVPHWLDGHFGAKKMYYFAPGCVTKLKVKPFIDVFNVDVRLPEGGTVRDTIMEFMKGKEEDAKAVVPNAKLIRKDTIVAQIERDKMGLLEKMLKLPCTISIGITEEEAKNDCKEKKLKKKKGLKNHVLFLFMTTIMVSYYVIKYLGERIIRRGK